MRAGLLRLLSAGTLLVALASLACAQNAVAPVDGGSTPALANSENVYIVSADDVILNGRLFGAENDVAVVLTHMQPNDQTAWFPFAQELAANGFAALTFNFRSYGDSGGDRDYSKLDDDLAAAVRYLHDRGKQHVFVVGASMGGTTALVVAAEADVDGVAAISAPARFEEQDALAAAPEITVPKLLMASEGDEAAVLSLDELRPLLSQPAETEVYPGNLHGTALFDPQENDQAAAVRARVLRFLQDYRP